MTWWIRAGRVDEIDCLVAVRRTMFEAMGCGDDPARDRACAACHERFRRADLLRGVAGVGACGPDAAGTPGGGAATSGQAEACEGEPITLIGLVVHSVPPGPNNLVGKVGYLMNLVTLPAWGRRGIARTLVCHVLDVLCAEGVPVAASLHASGEGRRLYEELGFRTRDEHPERRLLP